MVCGLRGTGLAASLADDEVGSVVGQDVRYLDARSDARTEIGFIIDEDPVPGTPNLWDVEEGSVDKRRRRDMAVVIVPCQSRWCCGQLEVIRCRLVKAVDDAAFGVGR